MSGNRSVRKFVVISYCCSSHKVATDRFAGTWHISGPGQGVTLPHFENILTRIYRQYQTAAPFSTLSSRHYIWLLANIPYHLDLGYGGDLITFQYELQVRSVIRW